ncbi:MAG: hypothetical protein RBU21_10330 [FCB group bacterium]|jgi:hypothetical protein|nr:hypothetical protein [FCB group bacterium]
MDTQTLEAPPGTAGVKTLPHEPLCVLETTAACRLLGIYLAMLYMVAGVLSLGVHEWGHILGNALVGVTVHGFYLSPAFGRTFSLYPNAPSVAMGFETMAGIALTQVTGYVLYAVLRRTKRTRWFFAETFVCVFTIALLVGDSIYMLLGLALRFGDPHEALRNFGIPSGVLWVVAFAQIYVAKYLSERVAIRWFRAYFVMRPPRGGSVVVTWCFLGMIGLSLIYAAYAACFG